MKTQQSGVLTEHEGSRCPSCGVVFFRKAERCGRCGGPVEPAKWYTRFCLERLLFIVTAVVVSVFVALLVTDDAEARVTASLLWAFTLPATYLIAHRLTGIGGLTEKFAEGTVPARAHLRFSWGRYFSELIRIAGIVLALCLLVGIGELVRWAFSGGK